MREVQKEYGDARRTEIVDNVEEIKLEDLIADVDMAITVSHAGYIKRTPVDTYRHQSRGGKGRIGAKTREEDFVEYLFVASAHSYILLFSSKGRVYWLKVYEFPEAAAATRGKAISQPGEIPGRRTSDGAGRGAQPGRGRHVCFLRHAQRHGEEDRARGILQPALDAASSPSTWTARTS